MNLQIGDTSGQRCKSNGYMMKWLDKITKTTNKLDRNNDLN